MHIITPYARNLNRLIKRQNNHLRFHSKEEKVYKTAATIALLTFWKPVTDEQTMPPEISTQISEYLNRKDAVKLVRTCKAAYFYAEKCKLSYLEKHGPSYESQPLAPGWVYGPII